MSQVLTKPLLTDETGQDILDKLDEIISSLSPNAQGVSFDKTGCQIITTNNVQDAVKQLDTGLNNTNASLTQLESKTADSENTSFTFPSTVTQYAPIGSGCNYSKKNGMIILDMVVNVISSASSWVTVFTLPEGFRPKYVANQAFNTWNSGNTNERLDVQVQPDGRINLRAGHTTAYYIHLVF